MKLKIRTWKIKPLDERGRGWWNWEIWIKGYYYRICGWHIRYDTRKEAKEAALLFINKCLTDRETWPDEFK